MECACFRMGWCDHFAKHLRCLVGIIIIIIAIIIIISIINRRGYLYKHITGYLYKQSQWLLVHSADKKISPVRDCGRLLRHLNTITTAEFFH